MSLLGPTAPPRARVAGAPGSVEEGARRPLSSGWPLTALLVLYPLWWALGMGTLIVFVLAVPMSVHLVRRRPVMTPPGFGLWLLFLAWVLISTVMLSADPPGTLHNTVSGRLVTVGFNAACYFSATIVLLYAGNLSEREFPRQRLVRQLGFFFLIVLGGGLVGTFAPALQFTSLVERLLPTHVAQDIFVQSLVHPAVAQLQDVLGFTAPRPSAPFGYTNTWGNCLALVIGWFVISWVLHASPARRTVGIIALALAAIPTVYSLNRGLWIGLGFMVAIVAVRLALRGRVALLGAILVGGLIGGVVLASTPLATVVQERLDNPKSNSIRAFTTDRTLQVLPYSPVIGFGSTRAALGSANSIAIGQDARCPRCGNPTLGSNGQIWMVLISQGLGGVVFYVGFILRSMWVYWRDRSPIGDAGILALVLPLWFMWVYNALAMPLVISFLSIALLWRNQHDGNVRPDEALLPIPAHGLKVRTRTSRA